MNIYREVRPIKNSEVDSFVEDCNLFAVFDAPLNVIFADNFIMNIKKYKDIFTHFKMPNNIFFSCKSNKSHALLKYAADNGCGIEVSSLYELEDAIKHTNRIIASGPAKDIKYLCKAIENNAIISVDDIYELKKIKEINKNVKVFLRLSDLLNIISRFGINIQQLNECLDIIKDSKIQLEGISFHINNYNLDDRIKAIKEILNIIEEKQISIKYIDIGGGFPTNYCTKEEYENFLKNNNNQMYFKNKNITDFYQYYSDVADENSLIYIFDNVNHLLNGIEIIVEPGRSLLSNCGISIYRVEYLKRLYNDDYLVVTNGNINCLSEQWFNSDYLIEPKLIKRNKGEKLLNPIYASIAGNLCLEQDMITWRKIKFDYMPENGDYLIYFNTAGYQMDSNESTFHKIPLVKKVVVYRENNKLCIKGDDEYDSE